MTDRDWIEVGLTLSTLDVDYTFGEQKKLMDELTEEETSDEDLVIGKFKRLFPEKFNNSHTNEGRP